MKQFRLLVSLLSLFLLFAVPAIQPSTSLADGLRCSHQAGLSKKKLREINTILKDIVRDQTAKGAVAAVQKDGKLVYLKAKGKRDGRKPMRTDTLFRICSQTKLITATALMMLYEEEKFGLYDPISDYIPEFKDMKVLVVDDASPEGYRLEDAKKQITIYDLLTHTSGITYAFWGRPYLAEIYLDLGISDGLAITYGTVEDNVRKIAQAPLYSQPGEKYEYGLNMDVLGYFIEIISGMSLDAFFQERIFDPLGMDDTFFFIPEDKVSRLAAIYEKDENGVLVKVDETAVRPGILNPEVDTDIYDPFYPYAGPRSYLSGGAGLTSTIEDYMKFCQMLLNRGELDGVRLLNPITVDFMTGNHSRNADISPLHTISGNGLEISFGSALVNDGEAFGNKVADRSIYWSGFYATNFDIDFKNKMIYMLYTQRTPYQSDQLNEFNQMRRICHEAIID